MHGLTVISLDQWLASFKQREVRATTSYQLQPSPILPSSDTELWEQFRRFYEDKKKYGKTGVPKPSPKQGAARRLHYQKNMTEWDQLRSPSGLSPISSYGGWFD